jgi:hypothetical protein
MGRIADSLRANLREIAQSDARSLREMDAELKAATKDSSVPQFSPNQKIKALLGEGSWKQTNKILINLCRSNGIKGFSSLKKAGLVALLKKHGVKPPPRALESFTKKELVQMLRQLLG